MGEVNWFKIGEVISELINLKKLDLNLGSNIIDYKYNVELDKLVNLTELSLKL